MHHSCYLVPILLLLFLAVFASQKSESLHFSDSNWCQYQIQADSRLISSENSPLGLAHFCRQPTSTQAKSVPLTTAATTSATPPIDDENKEDLNPSHEPIDVVDVAFFLQITEGTLHLLPRLLVRIHHPSNLYLIHIDIRTDDRRTEDVRKQIEAQYGGTGNDDDDNNNHKNKYLRNVVFMERSVVTYRGITMVLNTIAAMELALRLGHTWSYFINLSGADYPLLTPLRLRTLLTTVHGGRRHPLNFFALFPPREWNTTRVRMQTLFLDPALGLARQPQKLLRIRNLPLDAYVANLHPVKSEAWMVLSREFVNFVVASDPARRMLVLASNSVSSPEHYFILVAWNHPYWNKTIVQNGLRLVLWIHHGVHNGQHPYVLDRRPDRSESKDVFYFWKEIKASGCLFGRKFSIPNSELLDRIDREISCYQGDSGRDREQVEMTASCRDFYHSALQLIQGAVQESDKMNRKT